MDAAASAGVLGIAGAAAAGGGAVGEAEPGPVLAAGRACEVPPDLPGGALVPQAASAASRRMIKAPDIASRIGLIATPRPDAAAAPPERQLVSPGAIFPASLAPHSRARVVSSGCS